jgi:hypothetical protein
MSSRASTSRVSPPPASNSASLRRSSQQQADRKRQRAAGHQARQLGGVVVGVRAGAQEGVALRLVQHQFQAQHRHVVADPRLRVEQGIPQGAIGFAVDHALEQVDEQRREVGAGGDVGGGFGHPWSLGGLV